MLGCQTCAAIDECAVCKETFTFHQGIYYDESAELCLQCSPFCSHCNRGTAFHCEDCILDQHRVLVGTTCVCDKYNYKEPEIRQVCVKKDVKKCTQIKNEHFVNVLGAETLGSLNVIAMEEAVESL